MPTQDEVFAAFVEKWVGKTRPRRGLDRDLVALERELGIVLPASYVTFLLTYGVCGTTLSLLHSIVEGEHDVHDLSWFDDPRKVAEGTAIYESGGMPKGYVGFGSDCMGNMFLFRRRDCVAGADDAPVHFFDHDFVTTEQIAPSFVAWMAEMVAVPFVPDDD